VPCVGTGAWHNAAEFRDAIAGEAPIILFWGRLLGVTASAVGVFILTRMLARTIASRSVRLLVCALLALNPIDLVSSAWLKFDGAAYLMNAVMVAALITYLRDHDGRARRRLYALAIVVCSFRIDLSAFLIATVAHDLVHRHPFAPVRRAIVAGALGYATVTLLPLVLLYRALGRGAAAHAVTGSNLLAVSNTFEQNITKYFRDNLSIAAIVQTLATNLAFYALLLLALGPLTILALWPGLPRNREAKVCLTIAAILLAPLLLFPANGTRYFLLLSVQLILVAGWTAASIRRPALRYAVVAVALAWVGSLTIETVVALRGATDSRIAAGRYLIEQSNPHDLIAIEGYVNPGHHPVVDECPDELRLKAKAIRESGLGTGETLRLKADRSASDCRRVLEITARDRFAGTPYQGRWINVHDAAALANMQPPPLLYAIESPDVGEPAPPAFVRFIAERYELVRVFEPRFSDPRLRWLLTGTPYYMKLLVYRLKA